MGKTDYHLLDTRLARGCLGAMARTPLTDSFLVSLFMHKEKFHLKRMFLVSQEIQFFQHKKLMTNLLFISDIG